MLRGHGRVLTEHIGEENLTQEGEDMLDREIHDRDIEWLRSATCLVAEVTTPSLGVGYEIGRAVEWGTPVLCLFRSENGRKLSAMIGGCTGISTREYHGVGELENVFADFFGARTP